MCKQLDSLSWRLIPVQWKSRFHTMFKVLFSARGNRRIFEKTARDNRLMIEHYSHHLLLCVTRLTGLSNFYIHCCQLK